MPAVSIGDAVRAAVSMAFAVGALSLLAPFFECVFRGAAARFAEGLVHTDAAGALAGG